MYQKASSKKPRNQLESRYARLFMAMGDIFG